MLVTLTGVENVSVCTLKGHKKETPTPLNKITPKQMQATIKMMPQLRSMYFLFFESIFPLSTYIGRFIYFTQHPQIVQKQK